MSKLKAKIEELLAQGEVPKSLSMMPKNKIRAKSSYGTKIYCTKTVIVYYIKLCFPSGLTLYKLGYTSTSLRTRVAFMELPAGTKVTTLATVKLSSSRKAYYAEQLLHQHFAPRRYYGPPMLASGNTELYSSPLF